MRVSVVTLVSLCFFLPSCGPSLRSIPHADPSDPRIYSASLPAAEYRIQPGDQLDIKFFYSPELNEQMPVRPDGRISLQLAHDIMAAGRTPAELSNALKEKYSTELKNPEVTVIVRTFGDQRIYVDGEVARPGLLPLTGPTTVLQAVAQAGGFLASGSTAEVVVIRRGPENKPIAMRVDMEKVRGGIDTTPDIYLKAFDMIYVPRTAIANVDLWIDQYLNRVVPRIGFVYSVPVGSGTIGIDTTSTITPTLK